MMDRVDRGVLGRLAGGIEGIQRRVMNGTVDVLVFLVLIALAWAVVSVAEELVWSIGQPSFERFKAVTSEVLTIFIFIEMFTLLTTYVREQRLRLTHLVDATIAIVMREVWVRLYAGHVDVMSLLGLSAVIASLGLLRVVSVRFSLDGLQGMEDRMGDTARPGKGDPEALPSGT